MDKKPSKRALTYIPYGNLKHEGENYTLIPNKNGGLCDILPVNDWSDAYLSMHIGADIRILERAI